MTMRKLLRRWPFATPLFLLHSALFLLLICVISADRSQALLLLIAYSIDWPSSLLAVAFLEATKPLRTTTHSYPYCAIVYLLLGGTQWALIGSFFDALRREMFPKARPPANPSV